MVLSHDAYQIAIVSIGAASSEHTCTFDWCYSELSELLASLAADGHDIDHAGKSMLAAP